ncbi:hypothetical protein [Sanguibacter suarezii]|uniref:hypothetical protein n=1 Tax=Sanguibacter suarezii TaxID=60921 RepID=UPI00082C1E36|nr:hypothetical protein [Sanguibacter suarezii]
MALTALAVLGAGLTASAATAATPAALVPASASTSASATASATATATGTAPSEVEPCGGVSIIVDFGALDAPGVRGCAPVESRDSVSGLDALVAAGVSIEGTAQWGTAFVCRVDGRPGAEEDIVLPDGQLVRESCARTPSQQAYWSLWHADQSEWRYATTGVGDLDLAAGDTLALVFTTGPQAAAAPEVLPEQVRSGDLPEGWTDRTPAGSVATDDSPTGDSPTDDSPTGGSPADGSPTGDSPTSDAPTSDDPTSDRASDASSGASPTGVGIVPVVAIGLVLCGGVGAAVVARRRR